MALKHVQEKRFTAEEFTRLFETGALSSEERLELIDGRIVPLSLHEPQHTRSLIRATDALTPALHATHYVGVQIPVVIGKHHQPQPDLSVYRRSALDTPGDTPEKAVLLVEISNTSLAYDRDEKASLYASSGVPEYWIVNLRTRQVEVYRDAAPDDTRAFGYWWRSVAVFNEGEIVYPLDCPDVEIAVADLF